MYYLSIWHSIKCEEILNGKIMCLNIITSNITLSRKDRSDSASFDLPRRHFLGKPVMASRNVGCFLRLYTQLTYFHYHKKKKKQVVRSPAPQSVLS